MNTPSTKADQLIQSVIEAAREQENATCGKMSRGTLQRRGWQLRDARNALSKYIAAVEAKSLGTANFADLPAKGSTAQRTATRGRPRKHVEQHADMR